MGSPLDSKMLNLVRNTMLWKLVIIGAVCTLLFHGFLCLFFGISIGWINPFLMKMTGIGIKTKSVDISIRSIRLMFSLSSSSKVVIVLDGVDVMIKPPVSTEENEGAEDSTEEGLPFDKDMSKFDTKVPLCVFPESPFMKWLTKLYLLYFRFVGVKLYDLSLSWENTDIILKNESALARVNLKQVEGNYSFGLNFAIHQQTVNGVDLFEMWIFDISGFIDMKTGNLSKLKVGSELRNMRICLLGLLRKIAIMREEHHLNPASSDKGTSQIDEDFFLRKFQQRLIMVRYFVNLVEAITVTMHGFSLSEIPAADSKISHCHHYSPLVFFELKVNSFVLDIRKMHFDSPGYGLTYDYDDKPDHLIFNFTGISVAMTNTKLDTHKQVVAIPVMNFSGSSNYAFQTLKAVKSHELTKSKLFLMGHLLEPVIDLSTEDIVTAILSFLEYSKHKEKLKEANMLPKNSPNEHKLSDIKYEFLKRVQKLIPTFDLKFGIENPVFMMKSAFEQEYYRILYWKSSILSLEIQGFRDNSGDQFAFHTVQKFDVHHLRARYQNTKNQSVEGIFKMEDMTLKQRIDIFPYTLVESSAFFQSLKLDLSNIRVLHGLNFLFVELQAKISPMLQSFRTRTNEFSCGGSPVLPTRAQSFEYETEALEKEVELSTLVQLMEDIVPEWLSAIRISLSDSTITLGSRSLLLSKELMKLVEPQSKNDLVGGQLRKFELYMQQIDLIGIFKTLDDGGDSSSAGSSLEDDDRGLDSPIFKESLDDSIRWKISLDSDKITGKVISEKSSKKDVLKDKVFLKINNSSIHLIPQEQKNKIQLKWDIENIEMLYSVMTHFLIISCLHLLRNTVFEFEQNMKPASAKPPLFSQKPAKSKFYKKKLLSMIELEMNTASLNLILVLSDGLKLRLDLSRMSIAGMINSPTTLKSHFIRLCAESPTAAGYWARLITAVDGTTTINLPTILEKGEGYWFELANETCNVSVPNQFVIYKIFENVSVMFKTLKQLHHSLKYNTNEFIINPTIKPAIKVPKMNLRSRRFIFSMDDDPFEAELNMIFQIGLVEQKMRHEKTKLFERKVAEEFENVHTVRGRSTFDTEKSHFNILEDFTNFIPISKKKIILKKKRHHEGKINQPATVIGTPACASEQIHLSGSDSTPNDISENSQKTHDRVFALRESFSKSWITRVKNFKEKSRAEFLSSFEFLRGGLEFEQLPPEFNRKVLEYVTTPSLLNLILEDLDLDIGPPGFGFAGVPSFIHDVGKGVPMETEYSILLPVHLDLKLKELRAHLRDYPIPLVYMPAITKLEPKGLPGVRVHGDYVIAEAAIQSRREVREVYVPLVPGCEQFDEDGCYSLEVPKTLTAIKSFTQLDWDLNSRLSTKVNWGTSFQPCIQQIMFNLDNFTKPPIDPSEKVGFWDKARMLFHARMKFNWRHGGNFYIQFKASKDPYAICAEDSGYALGFEKDVVLSLNEHDDPSEFMVVNSQGVVFAVPNHVSEPLLVWSRCTQDSVLLSDTATNFQSSAFGYYIGNHDEVDPVKYHAMKSQAFEKTVINLSGGVQFKLAIAFERKLGHTDHTSSFKPHYDVYLSNPKYVERSQHFDSYDKFRSDFIHLGFTLISTQAGAYNRIQLSPKAFHYFFVWWRMFSNTASIKHPLFHPMQQSAKFSRHLYTIKYQAILEPLFISDTYHDPEAAQNRYDTIECVGMKGKASRFVLDLHQRKELTYDHNANLGITKRLLKTKFNVGKVDLTELDLRAVTGSFRADADDFDVSSSTINDKDRYSFHGFDQDASWFDISDFIEIGQPLLSDYRGEVSVYPLMNTPKFVYSKSNSYGDDYQLDYETKKRMRPFGNEEFHTCTLSEGSLIETQSHELSVRLGELNDKWNINLEEIKSLASSHIQEDKKRVTQLKLDNDQIRHGIRFVTRLLEAFKQGVTVDRGDDSNPDIVINDFNEGSTFINRFTVHNMLLKWNDTNRDIIYRFIYLFDSSSTLNSFLQYKSLTQLNELIEQQRLANLGSGLTREVTRATTVGSAPSKGVEDEHDLKSSTTRRIQNFKDELRELVVSFFYTTHDRYFVKLLSPQIQLQTEEDLNSCIIVAVPNIELNVIAFDANETEEDSNENIFEQRIGSLLSNASIFMFSRAEIVNTNELFFRTSSYGSNESWPPWLGLEVCYDGSLISDHMLVNKTSLVVRYDKAIRSAFIPTEENSINKLLCDLSEAVITCDSRQYYTLYSIITQLLLYNEPREAAQKHRESKVLYSLNMNDLVSIKARIVQLQEAIRQTGLILQNFTIRRPILDDIQKDDMNIVASARYEAAEELRLLMHVSSSKDTSVSEYSDEFLEWFIKADDIKLNLLDEHRDPFVDVILINSHFRRIERSDRSDRNIISIQNLEVINLDKETLFPVIFSSYHSKSHSKRKKVLREDDIPKMIQISWNMDHPVGGIRVMKKFEIDLLPVQISLEETTGRKIEEFVFPSEIPQETSETDIASSASLTPDVLSLKSSGPTSSPLANGDRSLKRPSSNPVMFVPRNSSVSKSTRPNSISQHDLKRNASLVHQKSFLDGGPQEESLDDVLSKHGSSIGVYEDSYDEDSEADEMIERASTYLSFVSFKLKGVPVCITFRGQKSRRLINVTEFMLSVPDICFFNKTCTLLDITMHIKKSIIKTLLSHSASLIGNKLFKHSDGKGQKPLEGISSYANSRIKAFRG